MPKGDALRKAVRFIADSRGQAPERPVMEIVNEAMLRFDLNPAQADYLSSYYRKSEGR